MTATIELLFSGTPVIFNVGPITFVGPEERLTSPTPSDINFKWTAVKKAVDATIEEFGLYDPIRLRLANALIVGSGFRRKEEEEEDYAPSCFEAATRPERKL